MVSYILAIISGLFILGADQLTKFWISDYYASNNLLMGTDSMEFIPGVLNITYIHNDGAAWGMLGGYTWLLLSITIVIMLICIALLLKYGVKDKLMFWAVILVLSGGLGNMIDRLFRGGKVIDFLQFDFWQDFPVFNVADCAVVIGAGLWILYFCIGLIKEQRQKQKELADTVAQQKEPPKDENS